MILSRPVAPRATRAALIVASVPELTKRTRSSDGTSRCTSAASSTSSGLGAPKLVPSLACRAIAVARPFGAWPWIIGPHEPT